MQYARELKGNIDSILEIGQKILVKPATSSSNTYYYSNIQDLDKEHFYITVPSDEKGRPIGFRLNEEVSVSITNRGKRYGFNTAIVGKKTKPFFMLALKKPEKVFVVELRQYFRVPIFVPFIGKRVVRVVGKDGISYQPPENMKLQDIIVKGHMHDISGGGVFITADKKLELEEVLLLRARLDDEHALADIPAKVVRKALLDPIRKKEGYGMMFIDIDDKTREQIIKFCFKRQRELRRAGEI